MHRLYPSLGAISHSPPTRSYWKSKKQAMEEFMVDSVNPFPYHILRQQNISVSSDLVC